MPVLDLVYLLTFLIFMFVIASCFLYERTAKIMPVPTMPRVKRGILKAITKHIDDNDEHLKIADLGSGWGGVAFSIAKAFPNARITGYEISPSPFWFSKILSQFYKNASITRQNFFDQDLRDYDVLVFYLTPRLTQKLQDKFSDHLKPGTLIISNAFPLPDWQAVEIVEIKGGWPTIPIYTYRA